ncbi:uncharacterized protein N7459_003293 [Penicillium hispanicum]|uniref:uncharacterized protein n=1 Tax=Penicillium hispanicum TaxID=1080232 RepID=UPI00254166D4|nr:uncharacterized protein N7459_003293 [Penicillium hispanicum]KAJ5587528.1 hypothetical protein N7459_003293 [Penicillium hispanicum]
MAKSKNKPSNSRAARRAASPSLDVDKSLVSAPRAASPTVQRPSILVDRANSGIQKKQKQKKMTRAQRLRQQKGMDKAEAVLDQLEIKKAKSLSRGKNVKARRADWEDMNRKSTMFAALQQDEVNENSDGDNAMTDSTAPAKSTANSFATQPTFTTSNPVIDDPAMADEDDEIT